MGWCYEALGDLPKIRRDVDTGEYILDDQYIGSVMTGYQKFMRDEIDHEEYLDSLITRNEYESI